MTTTTTTYTLLRTDGSVDARGLSAEDAAERILTHDGAEYRWRRDVDDWWCLQGRHRGRGDRDWSSLWAGRKLLIVAPADAADETAALAALAPLVISAGWPHHPEALPDAEYDRQVAEMAADAA